LKQDAFKLKVAATTRRAVKCYNGRNKKEEEDKDKNKNKNKYDRPKVKLRK